MEKNISARQFAWIKYILLAIALILVVFQTIQFFQLEKMVSYTRISALRSTRPTPASTHNFEYKGRSDDFMKDFPDYYFDGQNDLELTSVDGSELNLNKLAYDLKENNSLDAIEAVRKNSVSSAPARGGEPTSRKDLEKMRSATRIYDGSIDAGITVPGFAGVKLGKEEINLNVYYLETKVVIKNGDSVVYGCGYSVHYLFKKVKRGLSISDLPLVAGNVQVDSRKTQVFYSIQSYGVIGTNLVRYFKPTVNKKFDVEGYGIMQSHIDGIHNVLGDPALSASVKFTPEIIKFVRPYELEQP